MDEIYRNEIVVKLVGKMLKEMPISGLESSCWVKTVSMLKFCMGSWIVPSVGLVVSTKYVHYIEPSFNIKYGI